MEISAGMEKDNSTGAACKTCIVHNIVHRLALGSASIRWFWFARVSRKRTFEEFTIE
jgi:hypothetical protein